MQFTMNELEITSDRKQFEFRGRVSDPLLLVLTGAFLLVFFGYFLWVRLGFSFGFCTSVFVMLISFASIFYFRAGHMDSDLELSSNGISRMLFGLKWREMKWNEVVQMRILSQRAPGSFERATFIFVFSYNRENGWSPFKPAIVFTDRTNNKQSLFDILNFYVRKYKIKVYRKGISATSGSRSWYQIDSL